jgi:Fur family ferric uptake transcriptional regulator/Fur family peroxide stress response transcriptional regulator
LAKEVIKWLYILSPGRRDHMNMDYKEKAFQNLRKQNLRITNARKAIIDILEGKHLTLQEIYHELKKRGFHNLSTVYNNIDFLLEHKIITQVFINGKKHYDLTIEEYSHNADSHVHVKCLANDNIIEINEEEFIDKIKDHQVFEGFDISKLQLVVEGACKHYNSELCKDKDYCYLEKIKNGSH